MHNALLLFAGLFEAWQPQPGEWRPTFTIITTAANRTIEPIHNRMPVILDEGRRGRLDEFARAPSLSLKRPLVPAPNDLLAAGFAAGEQRQERGAGTFGGTVVIWPIAGTGNLKVVRAVDDSGYIMGRAGTPAGAMYCKCADRA